MHFICAHTFSCIYREQEMFCCLSPHRSVHRSFPLLPSTLWASARSMQFSNPPKEDSVEHVVISREKKCRRGETLGLWKWQCNVLGNKTSKQSHCESYISFCVMWLDLACSPFFLIHHSIKTTPFFIIP